MHDVEYEVVQISTGLYPVSGSSCDWVYDKLKVVDSYGFELRPNFESPYGFLLPVDQIRGTGEESVAGLMVLVDNIYKPSEQDDGSERDTD